MDFLEEDINDQMLDLAEEEAQRWLDIGSKDGPDHDWKGNVA